MNALAHCAEALYVAGPNPTATSRRSLGAPLIADALPRVLADLSNRAAREELLRGAMHARPRARARGARARPRDGAGARRRVRAPARRDERALPAAGARVQRAVVPEAVARFGAAIGGDAGRALAGAGRARRLRAAPRLRRPGGGSARARRRHRRSVAGTRRTRAPRARTRSWSFSADLLDRIVIRYFRYSLGVVTEPGRQFDVLVIGSGASGLAAAVSAELAGARVALATKGSLQANNSSKAQGGIQAAFGDDDSPEQHADDVFRLAPTRPPSARSSRRSPATRSPRSTGSRSSASSSRATRTAATASPAAAARARSASSRSATARATRSPSSCARLGRPRAAPVS